MNKHAAELALEVERWVNDVRDRVLMPAADAQTALGITAEGLGQCSVGVLAAIAALKEAIQRQVEPVAYQFQDREGTWCSFSGSKHYEDTVADGTWPIRALYTSAPTIPEGWQLVETKWLDALWVAHPNLDLDIEAVLSAAPKGETA